MRKIKGDCSDFERSPFDYVEFEIYSSAATTSASSAAADDELGSSRP